MTGLLHFATAPPDIKKRKWDTQMLNTKNDFIDCLDRIIKPLKSYYTPGKAGIKCGNTGVMYGDDIARLEGMARVLWGLSPLWAGGGNIDDFAEIYKTGIANGTDPAHKEYWGEMTCCSQRMVEAAPLGFALVMSPDKVWEPLTAKQKDAFAAWLYRINETTCPENNWLFFRIIVNLGLKNVGERYSEEKIKADIEQIHRMYKGNGWYSDGFSAQMDYYIAFAMHFYGLIYAKIMEREDPENSKIFKERAIRFAEDFIYWFDENGSAVAFGRSLTYRFAQCCFWSACVYAGIEPFDLGIIKGIISRNIEYWLNCDVFDNGGILSIGYEYPNLMMSEEYNSYGSPYWALKAFLILALDDDHEFFKCEIKPLPKLSKLRVIPEANMVIQRQYGYPVILTGGQWVEWGMKFIAEKYSKFAYSSRYSFCVSCGNTSVKYISADSMLIFEKDTMYYMRRKCNNTSISDDGTLYSEWSPFEGVFVKTYITPIEGGHIRKHIIESDGNYTVYDGAFAVPDNSGDIDGNGEKVVIRSAPNMNLSNNLTRTKAMKYNVIKGINEIETRVFYPEK